MLWSLETNRPAAGIMAGKVMNTSLPLTTENLFHLESAVTNSIQIKYKEITYL